MTNKQQQQNDKHTKRIKDLRKLLLDELGGKCSRCGFSDYRALQVDHTDGGGSEERKISRIFVGNPRTYGQIDEALARFALGEISLLCANCNWIKRDENKEHNKRGVKLTKHLLKASK